MDFNNNNNYEFTDSNNNNSFNNNINSDLLLNNLQSHILEMKENEKIYMKISKKFLELQNDFINISKEKEKIENELNSN